MQRTQEFTKSTDFKVNNKKPTRRQCEFAADNGVDKNNTMAVINLMAFMFNKLDKQEFRAKQKAERKAERQKQWEEENKDLIAEREARRLEKAQQAKEEKAFNLIVQKHHAQLKEDDVVSMSSADTQVSAQKDVAFDRLNAFLQKQ